MIPIAIQERTEVFENVRKAVAKKIFAPGFDAKEWARLCDAHRELILSADNVEQFEAEVRALLGELKISHITFFHQSLLKIPPQYAIGATFQREQVNGTPCWMFQDVHEGSPPHVAGIQPGDLLLEIEGTPIVPPEPPAFRMGGFCEIGIEKLDGRRTRVKLGVPLPRSKWHPIVRPRLVSWSKPEPGIGYLKVTGFPGQIGIDVAKEIDQAISEFRGCDRLIIDLRGNPGGGAGGLRLMSYMTPGKIPVGYSITQKRAAKGFQKEKLPRFDRIPSRKLGLIPLLLRHAFSDRSILMVNQHTASAAETIAGFAKENKLAIIVGTKTPGQVLGGTGFKMGHGFVLRIPVVTFHTWSGNTLEGSGIDPDQPVELSRNALSEGCDAQLKRATEAVGQF
jgi:carboxyl-terminal processing protease